MCIAPVKVQTPDGAQLVACRECWQCRQRKIDDYVGRCIAESKTAKKTHAFTLTYGTDEEGSADHIRARILTYSDFQKLMKKLRSAGYPARYFVVGEYGGKKGRAHWHGLIFWQDKVPEMNIRKERDHSLKWWEHGYSFIDDVSVESIRYACKYINKDMHTGGRQGLCKFSRIPPLGAAYFAQLADAFAKAGKTPNDLFYSFPGVDRRKRGSRDRERIKFQMQGKSAELFMEQFERSWEKYHGQKWKPPGEAFDEFSDKRARVEFERYLDGQRFKPYDPNLPANKRRNAAIKAWLKWDELRQEAKEAAHRGEDAPIMERIAEDNWLRINVLGRDKK